MNLIKPKKLKKGDTIGLLSVSGHVRDYNNIERAERYFQSKGFKTITSETTYKKFRYYSGTDEERIKAFEDFFANENINAIICTRGGYGTLRLVKDINYDIIRQNPKIFCGYSDLTTLLLMMYKKTGLVTFHGAMASGDFGLEQVSYYTEKSFFDTLCDTTDKNYYAENGQIYYDGEAEGILWGGNLSTVAAMIDLDFIPDEKFILFLEDVNENAYKIDRMLTQLFNSKKIRENIVALAVGVFTGIDNNDYANEVIAEICQKYKIPSCNGFKISHDYDKITIPVGIKCSFSASRQVITLQENMFID